MLRKIVIYLTLGTILFTTAYFTFVYYATYSDGDRSGELIKLSRKGVVFKTYEGEISQGISGAKIFSFSVLDNNTEVIEQLKQLQGQYVKISYIERYRTFPWWGDTTYFVTTVQKEKSPHLNR
ncbi:MAG: 6-phosphogluconate dehydrogenase [Bacteroidota bacterium]